MRPMPVSPYLRGVIRRAEAALRQRTAELAAEDGKQHEPAPAPDEGSVAPDRARDGDPPS
jgi:hypothetical protein